jgi:hypothetical protein
MYYFMVELKWWKLQVQCRCFEDSSLLIKLPNGRHIANAEQGASKEEAQHNFVY